MATVNGAAVATVTAKATAAGTKVVKGFPNHALGTKVELLLNGTWTDISHFVLVRDDVVITLGRPDESTQMDTSSLTLTLRNADGRFTPDNSSSPYYPYVQLNTQIRVSITDTSVTGSTYQGYRFWGEVSEWPPQWDPKGVDVYCQITASGAWRRLSQRTLTLGSPYARFNNQLNSSYNLVGYWPMEDGTGSSYFATTTPSTAANMTVVNAAIPPSLSSVSVFAGSDALPTLSGSELSGLISTSSSPTTVQFRFLMYFPPGGDTGSPGNVPLARVHLSGGISTVDVSLGPAGGGPLVITGKNSGGSTLFTGSSTLNIWGIPMMVLVNLTQQGSNVLWTMNTILPGATTWNTTVVGTVNSTTVSDASSVIFSPGSNWGNVCVGHAAVFYGNPPIASTADAVNGWTGENAMNRFVRLCNEEGIPVETIGSSATTMGPQADDTFCNVVQEIETTDGGLLYETRDAFGLGYRSEASMLNQSVSTTLDYSQQQVGQTLQPVVDDALTHNDIILTNNYDGYSVRVYLANGARSLQNPPNGVGTGYELDVTVNSTNHTQINNLGIQLLNEGTYQYSRYPTITANLARTTVAPLFNSIPSIRQGDYLQITNMPAFGGASTQKQLIWGWTETINNYTWNIAWNCIPEAPWESGYNPGTSATSTVPANSTPVGGAGGNGSGTVTSAQIVEGAIIGSNIAAGAVQGGNIATGTITATNIANATITGSLIGTGTILGTNIASATIEGSNIDVGTIQGSNIGSGQITATNIANATITTTQISGSAAITGTQIASATISASNIVSGTITATQIQNATITGAKIASGTITASNITNATITTSQISSTAGITGSQIAGGTITNSNIANATITNVQIAGGTITNSNISATAGITGSQLANATVTSVQISNGTITTTQISNTANITGTQIASGTITTGNIAANTITASDIAAGTITATQIAANTISAGNIAAGAITAGKIAAGAIDGMTITGANIVADGSAGQFLIYSGTPESGNLIGSWSGVSGTDGFGNTYPAGLSVQQGVITGLDIDSVTITNATLQGDILDGSTISGPQISGGTISETNVTFDSNGGNLLVYTSGTTNVTQTANGDYTWTVPANVTQAQVQVWGAGAGGNGGTTSAGGGGGSGGNYSQNLNYNVTPGNVISYHVGQGGVSSTTGTGNGDDGEDSFFDGTNGVFAGGGPGDGSTNTNIQGAGTVTYTGGAAGTGSASGGGGSGGNSGNPTANGNVGLNASSSTGAAAPSAQTGSGTGGAGGNNAANGSNGGAPGAGGGGAGKGSGTGGTKSVTYSPTWMGSYYGPDAGSHGGTSNGLRSTGTLYHGGETASGGAVNGTQRSLCNFNGSLAQMATDFSGYTMQYMEIQLKNEHTYYSSGMSVELAYLNSVVGGSRPGTYPTGPSIGGDETGGTGPGEEHLFSMSATGAAGFVAGTIDTIALAPSLSGSHPLDPHWYGYFDPSQVRLVLVGTKSVAGSTTSGTGADGKVSITYASGSTLVAAISPVASSDVFGNSFVAGGSFQNLQLYGASTPSTPPSNSTILYSNSNGSPTFKTSSGYNAQITGSQCDIGSHATSSNGTLSAAFPIGANDANVGTCYRIRAFGVGSYSSGATNTFQVNIFGSNQAACNYSSLPGTFIWAAEWNCSIVTTGSSGTMYVCGKVEVSAAGANASPNVIVGFTGGTAGTTVSVNTTASTTIGVQANITGTATFSSKYATFERIGA